MKTLLKKKMLTPETIDGACMTGRGMNKEEAILMEEWVKRDKIKNANKEIKKLQEKILSLK